MHKQEAADINATDKYGVTALIQACLHQKKDIVELLIKNGADVNFKDDEGETALAVAERWGHTDIVNIIKDHMKSSSSKS